MLPVSARLAIGRPSRSGAMTDAQSQKLGLLAKLVLTCLVVLAAAGVMWYGMTISTIQRLWRQLLERPDGPMAFRFILQPLMAAIAAFLHSRRDARTSRTSYFWALVSNGQQRVERLREALNATARIILLGLLMDAVYQVVVFGRFIRSRRLLSQCCWDSCLTSCSGVWSRVSCAKGAMAPLRIKPDEVAENGESGHHRRGR